MPTHAELAARELPEFEEKLQNLKGYINSLKEAAGRHDVDSDHYDEDLMRAENDAAYYEGEIGRLRDAAGTAAPPPTAPAYVKTDAGSLVQTGVAFAAGILVGLLVIRGRGGD